MTAAQRLAADFCANTTFKLKPNKDFLLRRSASENAEALDFSRASGNGAGEETRTLDVHLGKVVLYQLSYSRVREAEYSPRDLSVNQIF